MRALVFAFASLVVVACNGQTTSTSSSSSSSSGGTCTVEALTAKRVCVPGTAKAGVPLTLQAEGDGCLGCGTTLAPCKVDVTGTTITITAQVDACSSNEPCPAICGIPEPTCSVPPLDAGTYTVESASAAATKATLQRTLVVTADATSDGCTLLPPPQLPPDFAASDYGASCSGDGDCVLIVTGNVCAKCACPNAAIARSALPAYQADGRARSSQCAGDPYPCQGVPCAGLVAKCDGGTCKAVTAP